MLFSSTKTGGNYHGVVSLAPGSNITSVRLIKAYQAGKMDYEWPVVSNFTARILWDTLDVYTSLDSVAGQFLAFALTLS